MLVCDDVIQIAAAEPDSHFRLRRCPVCDGDNVAYEAYRLGTKEPWRVRCFGCGHCVDRQSDTKHGAQVEWNKEAGL